MSCVDLCCIEVAEKKIAKTKTKTAAVEDAQLGRGRELESA